MSRVPVPPVERGVEYVRSEDSVPEAAYWAAAPQRLLDYVSDYLGTSQTLVERPGGTAPARIAQSVREARTAWIGRMTTFSLRTVLDLLHHAETQTDKEALEPRVVELIVAARELLYGQHEVRSSGAGHRLDRALEAFAAEVSWCDQPEEAVQ